MGKRVNILSSALLIFIFGGIVAFFTKTTYIISNTLWIYIYTPIINFLTDWDFFAQLIFTFYDLLFIVGIVIVIISDGVIIPLALYHYFKKEKVDEEIKFWPPITIMIPAYNEEVNLARTIQTVYDAKYEGDKEIIVINDGSKDRTEEIAEEFAEKGMVELITRKNGGKTAAINAGLISARGEIIVVIDGDGIIKENALEELIKKFQRKEVGAVAGNIKVGNRVNLISKIQHLEYLRDINIPRRAFCMLDCVMVVPGPLGGFRRELLYSIGRYDHDTKTEDFDLTVKILKSKRHKIAVSQKAMAFTESPTSWRGLWKQRMRWYGGMLETLRKHRDIITFNASKYGNLSRIGGWYTFSALTFVPVMELFVFAGLVGYLLMLLLGMPVSVVTFLFAFLSFIAIELILTWIALAMEKENLSYGLWAPAFVFPYRQFLNVIKIVAFFKVFVLKKPIQWNKLERTGLPPVPT
ncbi:MAG: glycosyltransferase [Promethearchaeota archaeon]